jgi:hypothetical protein
VFSCADSCVQLNRCTFGCSVLLQVLSWGLLCCMLFCLWVFGKRPCSHQWEFDGTQTTQRKITIPLSPETIRGDNTTGRGQKRCYLLPWAQAKCSFFISYTSLMMSHISMNNGVTLTPQKVKKSIKNTISSDAFLFGEHVCIILEGSRTVPHTQTRSPKRESQTHINSS